MLHDVYNQVGSDSKISKLLIKAKTELQNKETQSKNFNKNHFKKLGLLENSKVSDDIVKNVKDALMFFKMSGVDELPTSSVMKEFEKRGLNISLSELQKLFPDNNEFLKVVSTDKVIFNKDSGFSSFGQKKSNKERVSDMAKKAANKRKG